MKHDWPENTGWFWTAFVLLLFVNIVALLIPTVGFVIIPVEIVVGLFSMRQNKSPGPHRMLGFASLLTSSLMIVVFVTVVLISRQALLYYALYSGTPYSYMNLAPQHVYSQQQMYMQPFSQPINPEITPETTHDLMFLPDLETVHRVTLEAVNRDRATLDAVVVNVTKTIVQATAVTATPTPTLNAAAATESATTLEASVRQATQEMIDANHTNDAMNLQAATVTSSILTATASAQD